MKAAAEPERFNELVRVPGLRAVAEMVGEKPPRRAGRRFKQQAERREEIPSEKFPAYWTEVLDDLLERYSRICAYSCFRIHEITGAASVDHFAPKSRRWDSVYEWSNYRLACSRMNARKLNFSDVLDPFEIDDDWFQLELVGFQVIPNPELKTSIQKQIIETRDRLKLNDYQFRSARERDAECYWNGDYSLHVLKAESPFVWKELCRQGRLKLEDQ